MKYKFNDGEKIYDSFDDIKKDAIEVMLSCICDFSFEHWNENHLIYDLEEMIKVLKCNAEDIKIANKVFEYYGFHIECIDDSDMLRKLMSF